MKATMETENQKLRERVEELSRETMLLAHTVTDLTAKLKLATSAAPQPVDAARAVPEFDDYPDYNEQAMGCGLEDRGATDRYEAMRYGWEQAIDRVAERINNFLADLPSPAAQPAAQGAVPFDREEFIRQVVQSVAEIPDRDSPEDQPEMMLVTDSELRNIMESCFENADEEADLAQPTDTTKGA